MLHQDKMPACAQQACLPSLYHVQACTLMHCCSPQYMEAIDNDTTNTCGMQAVHAELRVAKEDLVTREQQFERELATAQTLSGMYKEAAEARSTKVTQLEGVISELRAHLEVGIPHDFPQCQPLCVEKLPLHAQALLTRI